MSANDAFGIDHPLIAVNDIVSVRKRLCAFGFNMTPTGRHPWGTSTSLAIFDGCLLEIMGIEDDSLIDRMPAGNFRFGRHVHAHLQEREGVALTALHSRQIEADVERAVAAGLECSGMLNFGRDVTLPDGSYDRTSTSLAMLPDKRFPRLSFFLCQQHRPDLVYVSAWMSHPNGVCGIAGVTILAAEQFHPVLSRRFERLYGNLRRSEGGFRVDTANGTLSVLNEAGVRAGFPELNPGFTDNMAPAIVAMDFNCHNLRALQCCIAQSGGQLRRVGSRLVLHHPPHVGNVLFRFCELARAQPGVSF